MIVIRIFFSIPINAFSAENAFVPVTCFLGCLLWAILTGAMTWLFALPWKNRFRILPASRAEIVLRHVQPGRYLSTIPLKDRGLRTPCSSNRSVTIAALVALLSTIKKMMIFGMSPQKKNL